jgi:uncharacterized protein
MIVDLVVFAKVPVPGRSKTRLVPPLTSDEAAAVAAAMLDDTLAAVLRCRAEGRVLVLDGDAQPRVTDGFRVLPQRGDDQAGRLAAAFDDAHAGSGRPALLIGMDTPQVTGRLLDGCIQRLDAPGIDAVLGLARDGGWWALGLRRPDPRVLEGVPMSSSRTGRVQRARLGALGLRCALLPVLSDVDTIEDARTVAAEAPDSAFARALGRVRLTGAAPGASGAASWRGS